MRQAQFDARACPKCGGRTKVTHTVGSARRRVCKACGESTITQELPEALIRAMGIGTDATTTTTPA